jgi:MFS family permease
MHNLGARRDFAPINGYQSLEGPTWERYTQSMTGGGDAKKPIEGRPSGALWRHADFLRLWSAQSISSLGKLITREGLPLAAVLALHAGAGEIGVLAAIRAAPALLVGLTAGGMVDRARRRKVLIACDVLRAAVLLIVPVAAYTHHLVMADIWLAAALVGALSVLFDMADHAYLPSLIDRRLLIDANAKLGATESVAEIGGPAIAGALFSALTAPLAIAVNAVTYLASAAILATIRAKESVAAGPQARMTWRADAAAGFQISWRDPAIRSLLLMSATTGMFGGFFSALYIVFAVTTLGLTPAMLGATIAVGGLGALAGAAIAPWLGARLGLGGALIAAAASNALFDALIPLAGGSPVRGMGMLMAAQFLGDAVGTAALIYATSLRQGLLPLEAMGRVAGAFAAAAGLAAVAGALIGGELGRLGGMRPALFVACAGLALAPIWCLASPVRRMRSIPEAPITPHRV